MPFPGVVHNVAPMQLTEAQAQVARGWLSDGLKLSDFQKRVEKEFGLRLTYMDTRLLVDDLRVVPKDIEPPKAPEPAPTAASARRSRAMRGWADWWGSPRAATSRAAARAARWRGGRG